MSKSTAKTKSSSKQRQSKKEKKSSPEKGLKFGTHGSLHQATVCREPACENLLIAAGYCRLHYIKNWQKIKQKESILKEGKLQQYIEELVAKYPDKYIEAIRNDLLSDEGFAVVVLELDLSETSDELVDVDSTGSMDDFSGEGISTDFEERDEDF